MTYKSATQMAKDYGMKSPVAFNKVLEKCGVLVYTNKGYCLADDLHGRGLAAVIDVPYFLPNGLRVSKKKAVWTEQGQRYLHQRLSRLGIVPTSEKRDLFGLTSN